MSNTKSTTTQGEQGTIDFGQKLMQKYQKNLKDKCLIFALIGDLGTGKTQLAKGLAQGLKITELIVSPTFNLVREYNYQLDHQAGIFFHIDTWRLFDPRELEQIGLSQMIKTGNVIVIEWAEKVDRSKVIGDKLKVIKVRLEYISENQRRISLSYLSSLSS